MWSIPVEQMLGAEPEELPEPLGPGLLRWRTTGAAASRAALPDLQVEVVGDDRLGVAHVALGVREQAAAHLVRVARSGQVVEQQVAYGTPSRSPIVTSPSWVGGHAAPGVTPKRGSVTYATTASAWLFERGGLRGGVAGLERGGARPEERIVVGGVGGGDDEQVVLQLELGADVTLVSRAIFAYTVDENPCADAGSAPSKRNHRCGETDSGDDNGTADAA